MIDFTFRYYIHPIIYTVFHTAVTVYGTVSSPTVLHALGDNGVLGISHEFGRVEYPSTLSDFGG